MNNFINKAFQKTKDYFSNFQRPSDEKAIEQQTKRLNENKPITINNPRSERFSFTRQIVGDDKKYNNFHPTTADEKETLSPNGFFRIGEIGQERAALVERRLRDTEAQRKAKGKEFTDEQKELVRDQAEDAKLYEQDIPSTAINKFKYNPDTQELWVTFQGSNKKYWYPRVPKDKIEAMLRAPSKGEYFIENIHNVYSLNPSHKPSVNRWKNDKVASNYYKKMRKQYKNVRKKGNVWGY